MAKLGGEGKIEEGEAKAEVPEGDTQPTSSHPAVGKKRRHTKRKKPEKDSGFGMFQ